MFENNIIVQHKRYYYFIIGCIASRDEENIKVIKNKHDQRIGEIKKMNNGMQATIIEYRSHLDIDIKFDNGIIRKHVTYNNFKKGCVSPLPRKKD